MSSEVTLSSNIVAAFWGGVLVSLLIGFCLLAAHELGKQHMREEIKRYGIEQAMKVYEVKP